MLRCRELSRLPKAPPTKSVNFRRQTPGSVVNLLKPYPPSLQNYLCPTHPASSIPKQKFPNFRTDALSIRAFPFALLTPSEQVWSKLLHRADDSWKGHVERFISTDIEVEQGVEGLSVEPMNLNNSKANRVPMSFINATSKKRTSNKRHIRLMIMRKLKVAINLIVIRSADTIESNGRRELVMHEQEAEKMSNSWVTPGWTYIFFPTLEIYRMPYHDLIPMLRKALQQIWNQSQKMEMDWKARTTEAPLEEMPTKQAPLKHNLKKKVKAKGHSSYQRAPVARRSVSDWPLFILSKPNLKNDLLFSTVAAISKPKKPTLILDASDNPVLPSSQKPDAPNPSTRLSDINIRKKSKGNLPRPTPHVEASSDDAMWVAIGTPCDPPGKQLHKASRPRETDRPLASSDDSMWVGIHSGCPGDPPGIEKQLHKTPRLRETYRPPKNDGDKECKTTKGGSEEAAKPVRLAGVDFKLSPTVYSGKRPSRANYHEVESPQTLPFSTAEIQGIKSERNNAATWLGRSDVLLYQSYQRRKKYRRQIRSLQAKDLPADQFLFDVPPTTSTVDPHSDAEPRNEPRQADDVAPNDASHDFGILTSSFDPFADVEPPREPSPRRVHQAATGQSSFDPFPDVEEHHEPSAGRAHHARPSHGTFNPRRAPQSPSGRTKLDSAATRDTSTSIPFPTSDPYAHLEIPPQGPAEQRPDDRPSETTYNSSEHKPNGLSFELLQAFDPFPEKQRYEPQMTATSTSPSFPDFYPFPTTTHTSSPLPDSSTKTNAPQSRPPWRRRPALGNKLYKSRPIVLSWRMWRPNVDKSQRTGTK